MNTEFPLSEERRLRHRVHNAAVDVLVREGLTEDLLVRAAKASDCSADQADTFFRGAEEVMLTLCARFAADLETRALEFPPTGLAERFEAMMNAKFEIVAPYREALAALTATLLDPRSEIGALHPQTEVIRLRVQGVVDAVIAGATDPTDAESNADTGFRRSDSTSDLLLLRTVE